MFGQIKEVELTSIKNRTYHIGEVCLHGTVKVTVHQSQVLKIAFYNYKTNDLQESKVFDKAEKTNIMWYLEDRMSHYYADKIMKDYYE